MCCHGDYVCICVFAIIWTLIQSMIHISGTVYGYYVNYCGFKPSHVVPSIFYITYFYQAKCDALTPVDRNGYYIWDLFITVEDKEALSNFYDAVIKVNDHPENTERIVRLKTVMTVVFVFDFLWIISSTLLGMGIMFRIKSKWCFLFYGPYLIFTFVGLMLDVATTTVFGLDIPETHNVTQWLNFMNMRDFNSSGFTDVPVIYLNIPSLILSGYSSRLIFIWLINLAAFFLVMRATVINSQQAFEEVLETGPISIKRGKNTEERIKTWHMFYGDNGSSSSTETREGDSESKNRSQIRIANKGASLESQNSRNRRNPSLSTLEGEVDHHTPYSYIYSPNCKEK